MSADLEIIRKRLLWSASHRGIKEMDLVVGGFAAENLKLMSEVELNEFEILLDIPDQDLLSWLTNQEPIPQNRSSTMLTKILAYRPEIY